MADVRELGAALVTRILEGSGRAPDADRRAAFANAGLPAPLDSLVGKVAKRAGAITDADIASALSAGRSEDEMFEIVICAAVGESLRRQQAAQAALDQAENG